MPVPHKPCYWKVSPADGANFGCYVSAMKTYTFDAAEFAELEFLLGKAVSFFHQERSKAELDQFQAEFFPALRNVYSEILGSKIDDRQREAISESVPDPWDHELPSKQAVGILAEIFRT